MVLANNFCLEDNGGNGNRLDSVITAEPENSHNNGNVLNNMIEAQSEVNNNNGKEVDTINELNDDRKNDCEEFLKKFFNKSTVSALEVQKLMLFLKGIQAE